VQNISGVSGVKTSVVSSGCIFSSTVVVMVASLREAVVKLTSASLPMSGITAKINTKAMFPLREDLFFIRALPARLVVSIWRSIGL
jgi:hypothetical protein